MPISPLQALRDRCSLLAVLALPLTAALSILVAAVLVFRSPLALPLFLASVVVAWIAADAPENPVVAREGYLARLQELSLEQGEQRLFRAIVDEPNGQRIAAAAFGVGLLRLTALLSALTGLLGAFALLLGLLQFTSGPLAISAALIGGILLAMRLHDAAAARALGWLLPAGIERVVSLAEEISQTRLRLLNARIKQAILEDLAASGQPAA